MKNTLKNIISLLACAAAVCSCETQTTPEPVRVQDPFKQAPIVRDAAYFARLRAYKQTEHPLAFGWFGSWTAINASEQSRMRSTPDSMDIISLWSQWHSLTPAQIEGQGVRAAGAGHEGGLLHLGQRRSRGVQGRRADHRRVARGLR